MQFWVVPFLVIIGFMKTLFERQKKSQSPVVITEADETIFKALYDYDILSVEQLCSVLGKSSSQYMRKRLTALFNSGYVARPPIQEKIFSHRKGVGSRPLIHSLGQRGAIYLRDKFEYSLKTTNWDDKARNRSGHRGEVIFEHDLGANGILIELRNTFSDLVGVTVLGLREILDASPQATQKMDKPYSLPSKYVWPQENKMHQRNVIPDGVFVYRVDRVDVKGSWMVFIEFDNDSMPLRRTRGDHTSIQQKVAAYVGLHRSGLVKQRFGVNRFQVMFVTTGSQQHRAGMVSAAKEYIVSCREKVPETLFFWTTEDEFRTLGSAEKIWLTAQGKFRKAVG